MKKSFIVLAAILAGCTSAQISKTLDTVGSILNTEELTEADVAAGLKEALINGVDKGSDQASKTDGFYKNPVLKIPFPPEVDKVETKLRQLGADKLVDDFVLSLNRAAEKASSEAKPIFFNAVKSMTVEDAWGILKGDDNAATEYLKRTTSGQLEARFKPVIKESLDGVGATKHFATVVNYYNKIPLIEDVNPNLEDYATEKTMEGLFLLIEKEEKNIREDPLARTTDLLKKVFAQQ